MGRRTEVEMRKKSLDHEIHWYMVDVLMTFFSDTKTKEIFIESWWPGPGDWRVGLDYNLCITPVIMYDLLSFTFTYFETLSLRFGGRSSFLKKIFTLNPFLGLMWCHMVDRRSHGVYPANGIHSFNQILCIVWQLCGHFLAENLF